MSTGSAGAGIMWVVIALVVGFGITIGTDIYFEWKGMESVSTRIQRWARRYPLYAGGMVFGFGAILAHFFLNG
jgi:hypothetical protein